MHGGSTSASAALYARKDDELSNQRAVLLQTLHTTESEEEFHVTEF